ncbi:hypothetical protein [Halosolutus halophilus]|uniref:hypothetical protein n=1 Tax=Halosolutus halophilus TaxID=1552990 RepID=UPI0022351ACA|nr:hypothetical protein [Halosolutus halophilus]
MTPHHDPIDVVLLGVLEDDVGRFAELEDGLDVAFAGDLAGVVEMFLCLGFGFLVPLAPVLRLVDAALGETADPRHPGRAADGAYNLDG